MLKRRGLWAVLTVLAIFAVLHVGGARPEHNPRIVGTTLLGGFAFLLMAMSFWLATRPRFAEGFFGGLDRMYQLHKICGISAALLIFVHFIGVPKALPSGVDPEVFPMVPSAPLGMVSMVLLVILLAITLNRKVPYHIWRNPHKLMGVVFILVIGHVMTAPIVFFDRFGPSGIMLTVAAVIGVLSYLYNLFGMNRATGRPYLVETLKKLERATEVTLVPLADHMDYRAGQFAFVQIKGKGWSEPHPFTISSSTKSPTLSFTVKVLGDWTRKVRDELIVGQEVTVRGPYGRFDTTKATGKQVWLAGGIGITPFLSQLRDLEADDNRDIWLVYAVRDESQALYIEELRQIASDHPNVRLVMLESEKGDFARVDIMKTKLDGALSDYAFFLCGPKPMVKGLIKDLKAEGVKRTAIHTEAFEFR